MQLKSSGIIFLKVLLVKTVGLPERVPLVMYVYTVKNTC